MNRPGRRSAAGRSAFTLLELTLVVGLLVLVSSTAVLILRTPIRAARIRSAEASLRLLDAQLRQSAVRGERAVLRFDLDRQSMAREIDGVSGTPCHLPIREFRLVQQTFDSGRVEVVYDSTGASPSFALRWPDPAKDEWVLVCGGTGQFIPAVTERDVAILQVP
jgi:type II secretory pathway pseudopilin PulG